jgi:hypothetical protein
VSRQAGTEELRKTDRRQERFRRPRRDAQERHLKRRLKSASPSDIQPGLGQRLRCPLPEGTDEHQLPAGIAQRLRNGSSGEDRLGKLRRRRYYRRDRQPYNHTRSRA